MQRRVSVLYRSLAQVDHSKALCTRCGSAKLTRLMSRVRVLRGADASDSALGPQGDVDGALLGEMENLNENDPRALGRFMRKMAAETGEDLGPEFGEVIGRLEKGEDPERIESEMGDLMGGPEGMSDAMGDDGGALPAPAPAIEPARKAPRRARPAKAAN